jgi:hypothetical protein
MAQHHAELLPHAAVRDPPVGREHARDLGVDAYITPVSGDGVQSMPPFSVRYA